MQTQPTGSQPSYVSLLQTGELPRRVEALEALLERCTVCPRDCFNNRLENEIAACYSGRLPVVSSYTPHFGEEPPLVGTNGAGNIFFGNCNLRCVYCQNYQISQTHKEQLKNEVTHERLAEMMLELNSRIATTSISFRNSFCSADGARDSVSSRRGLRCNCLHTKRLRFREVLRLLEASLTSICRIWKYAEDEAGYRTQR